MSAGARQENARLRVTAWYTTRGAGVRERSG